jgi:hypothetical protein
MGSNQEEMCHMLQIEIPGLHHLWLAWHRQANEPGIGDGQRRPHTYGACVYERTLGPARERFAVRRVLSVYARGLHRPILETFGHAVCSNVSLGLRAAYTLLAPLRDATLRWVFPPIKDVSRQRRPASLSYVYAHT